MLRSVILTTRAAKFNARYLTTKNKISATNNIALHQNSKIAKSFVPNQDLSRANDMCNKFQKQTAIKKRINQEQHETQAEIRSLFYLVLGIMILLHYRDIKHRRRKESARRRKELAKQ